MDYEEYINIDNAKELLWEDIKNNSKRVENEMEELERRRTGSYYTSLELTYIMMLELVNEIKKDKKNICDMRFLEPCVGTGNFVFSYLKVLSEGNITLSEAKKVLDNIYVVDINKIAIDNYKNYLRIFSKVYFDIDLDDEYFNSHIGDGLIFNTMAEDMEYIDIYQVFSKNIVKDGFDIVVTNPPYKNLKVDKKQYKDNEEYFIDKEKYNSITKLINKKFTYATEGVINLYKLFVEEIIDRYVNKNGYVSLLIPTSILSDRTCQKLRTHMLKDKNIISVKVCDESNQYVDAKQSVCSVFLKNQVQTTEISITKNLCRDINQTTKILIDDIINDNTGNAIFAIDDEEYKILKKLRKFPTVKNLDFVKNMRGELDLTANKASIISDSSSKYKLIRGRNIKYYGIEKISSPEYVTEEFVKNSSKNKYIFSERIVCQQIANMTKERRITFAYIEENFVLGNSCNFVCVEDNSYNLDIYALMGLFNSDVINWYFKLTSTNNHINNYEIDNFPIPIRSKYITKLSSLVKEYLQEKEEKVLKEIERCANLAYEVDCQNNNQIEIQYYNDIKHIFPCISNEEILDLLSEKISFSESAVKAEIKLTKKEILIGESITNKYVKLKKGEILNHTTFKLSELDMEMVRAVPPGGNWKMIPKETVEKSKRLTKINQTGGRTTLYGRISYDKPSYTITTYFNRPGNGTYIHPVHDRVLSVREAARFQCFKDDYYFYGNKTQVLKQIGNAVPTLLAYQIAQNIVEKCSCKTSVDLFCGAGGMTAGFKEAGISSVLSNDIEESACITLKVNNPEINVFCGDITEKNTKDHIVEVALENNVDIICGGPPCQGFSMAGYRLIDDPRNQLFKEFVEVVERIKPKVIVFENVEGFLTFQGGEVYKEVLRLFSDIGYNTEGRLLLASEYAVPQKRKRVIIICTRNDINIEPKELFPKKLTENEKEQVTAYETIFDLEEAPCGTNTIYYEAEESDIVQMLKGKISYQGFVANYINKTDGTFKQLSLLK